MLYGPDAPITSREEIQERITGMNDRASETSGKDVEVIESGDHFVLLEDGTKVYSGYGLAGLDEIDDLIDERYQNTTDWFRWAALGFETVVMHGLLVFSQGDTYEGAPLLTWATPEDQAHDLLLYIEEVVYDRKEATASEVREWMQDVADGIRDDLMHLSYGERFYRHFAIEVAKQTPALVAEFGGAL